jgi:hypothetical protein
MTFLKWFNVLTALLSAFFVARELITSGPILDTYNTPPTRAHAPLPPAGSAAAAGGALAPPPLRRPLGVPGPQRWWGFGELVRRVLPQLEDYYRALGMEKDTANARNVGSMVHTQRLQYLADAAHARVICEVGFFRGASVALYLAASNLSVVHSIDLFFPGPETGILPYFSAKHPGRLTTYQGSSSTLIPQLPTACDFISIDGSHELEAVLGDILAFRAKAAREHIVYIDDVFDCFDEGVTYCATGECGKVCDCATFAPCNPPSAAVKRAVDSGVFSLHGCFELPPIAAFGTVYAKGFCVGQYVNPGGGQNK